MGVISNFGETDTWGALRVVRVSRVAFILPAFLFFALIIDHWKSWLLSSVACSTDVFQLVLYEGGTTNVGRHHIVCTLPPQLALKWRLTFELRCYGKIRSHFRLRPSSICHANGVTCLKNLLHLFRIVVYFPSKSTLVVFERIVSLKYFCLQSGKKKNR